MTNEEKQVVLKALERGKISGKDRSYFENGRWRSVPRLMDRARRIVEETIPSD